VKYLALGQIRERVIKRRAELEALAVKALTGKPWARLWKFFGDPATCLLSAVPSANSKNGPRLQRLSSCSRLTGCVGFIVGPVAAICLPAGVLRN
jgi:hypothetical protein